MGRSRRPIQASSEGGLPQAAFWSVPLDGLVAELGTSSRGLSADEAQRRFETGRGERIRPTQPARGLHLFIHQFQNPIAIILIGAAVLAFFLGDPGDAAVILGIVVLSGGLGFWHERKAVYAVAQLLALVRTTATVRRDGVDREVGPEEVVPGDIVVLSPGDHVPGDGRLISSNDLFIDEAALTGEGFPVPKTVSVVAAGAPLAQRTNAVFLGTHVVSGNATMVIVHTGSASEFGAIAERLRLRPPETAFERGVRRFGYLLLEVTLLLVLAIFAFNVALHRPVLDSFLFGLALAVGLTPQLLPAIISVNLAHGARRMAHSKVIVRRLASIENFGSMEILCCDKTGTLTEGEAIVHSAISLTGEPSAKTLLCAQLNSYFQLGRDNPIDRAIREHEHFDGAGWQKLDERPYDFARKRLTVLCAKEGQTLLCTKGAVANVLEICTMAEGNDGAVVPLESVQPAIEGRFEELSSQGYRTLAVACRTSGLGDHLGAEDEANLTFLGFVVLRDPIKPGTAQAIGQLRDLGVSLKVITGDNRWIAQTLGREVGVKASDLLTGSDLHGLSEAALVRRVTEVDLFAEVEPAQKERIILALKKAGHVVGFVGDGINDATALHSADVGISVEGAADVAKQAADIVLLEKDLGVLATGVREGRATFANTMKYVLMATSANFGNMFSMAGASLLLPFLPLRPSQILLMNLLTDLPEMTIASDRVDEEMAVRPQRWDLPFIQRFMLVFGLVSSVFDYLTFAVLLWVMDAPERLFRTGWFVESVVSAALIVLVVRTRHPLYRSRPGRLLLATSLVVVAVALIVPYLPGAEWLGFQHLPPLFYLTLGAIVAGYVVTAEIAKRWFYRHYSTAPGK